MVERADSFRELRWSLQALAASSQPSLFPEWAATPDHLAVDFDHRASIVLENYRDELDDRQRMRLEAIGELLDKMSRDGVEFDADLWSTAALESSEQWGVVRRLALEALEAFGWPADLPPADVADPDGE
jgi:hypothetical protein